MASYEEVVTLENLLFAYHCACRGKRHRPSVQRYEQMLGKNLSDLLCRLLDGSYKPRACYQFEVFCTAGQKRRLISAPAFEDTIVQHLLYQLFYPKIERAFIFDSYGCRKGKGTHKAADRVQDFMRQAPEGSYVLQLDVRKYYYRINHDKLRPMLERLIRDKRLVDLTMQFVGDGPVGLNVGSLLSQLFGMIYLDGLDHYIKRTLRVKHYVRYVDDMVLILPTREEALKARDAIIAYLKTVDLELSKWRLQPITRGINFAGLRTWPTHRLIRKRSLKTFGKALKTQNTVSLTSILGHAAHTSSCRGLLLRVANELPAAKIRELPEPVRYKVLSTAYPEFF